MFDKEIIYLPFEEMSEYLEILTDQEPSKITETFKKKIYEYRTPALDREGFDFVMKETQKPWQIGDIFGFSIDDVEFWFEDAQGNKTRVDFEMDSSEEFDEPEKDFNRITIDPRSVEFFAELMKRGNGNEKRH
jgi:hypothetical protein